MKYRIIIRERALSMIQDAYQWYEIRQKGLGDTFLAFLDEAFQKLQEQPQVYAQVKEPFQRVLLRKFPYMIICEVAGAEVVIYAVFHTRQHPDQTYWK